MIDDILISLNTFNISIFIIPLIIILFYGLYLVFKQRSKSDDSRDFEWLTPPEQFIKINKNQKIAYKQIGSGKDILFIHGIGANTYCWRYLQTHFDQQKYRLTFIDLPGFGYSSKNQTFKYNLDEQSESLIEFCKKLKLEQPIIISSSMGGAISLNMSLIEPDYITKIIAIAPAAGTTLIPILLRRIKNVSFFFNWVLNKKIMILILKRIFTQASLINPQVVEGYLNPYLQNKTESIYAFVKSAHLLMDKRIPLHFNGLKCSPLILASRKDKMVRKKHIKDLLSSLPNYEFHLHPTAGHHLMEDDPEWVYNKIINHLK